MSAIESTMQEKRLFAPSADWQRTANLKAADFAAHNARAAADYEGFWGDLARQELLWHKPFTRVLDETDVPFYKWFADGELNASYNCLDRNLKNGNADKVAIVFESDDGKATRVTYQELYQRVCKLANALKSLGVRKGDRVVIYMPMSVEGVAAMQACARIGAIALGGVRRFFREVACTNASSTYRRRSRCSPRTGNSAAARKFLPIKPVVDEALALGGCETVKTVIVYKPLGQRGAE